MKKDMKMRFPFSDLPNTACFTCCHVLNEQVPIKYVSHDEDGCWQFLCGKAHILSEARTIALSDILKIDKTAANFAKLGYGEYAEYQDKIGRWIIQRN